MKLCEVAGNYEKKRVIMYNQDQTKALYHNIPMTNLQDNIYVGEPVRDGYGTYHVAVFAWFESVNVGIMLSTMNDHYDDQDAINLVKRAHMDSIDSFIEFSEARINAQMWITLPEIELLSLVSSGMVCRAMESRKAYRANYEAKREEEARKRKEEDAVYVTMRNAEAQEIVNTALDAIRNGGRLDNKQFSIYKSRYDSVDHSVIAYLMDVYGIKLPIRTRGWINNSLANVIVEQDGKCEHCQYYKRGRSNGSNSFWQYMHMLIEAVRNQAEDAKIAVS